jgi:hypothetical protein
MCNSNHTNMKRKILQSNADQRAGSFNIRTSMFPVYLVITMFLLQLAGCEKDDLVYEEISIEECQDIFGSTPGAQGWSWDPQD